MDNDNEWTESAIAATRLFVAQYIAQSSLYLFILTLLVVFSIIWKVFPHAITPRRSLCVTCIPVLIPLVWELAPQVLEILVHTGLKFGEMELVPRTLPNECELARIVEGKKSVWPCARDEVDEAWGMGGSKGKVLRENLLWIMGWRMVFVGGIWVGSVWLHSWLSEREGRRRERAKEVEGESVDQTMVKATKAFSDVDNLA